MKIIGMMPAAPGEAMTQLKTEPIEVPEGGDKVISINSVKAHTDHSNNLNTEVKHGMARVFERLKLVTMPPPPPFAKNDRRRRAINMYKNFGKDLSKKGEKLDTAA